MVKEYRDSTMLPLVEGKWLKRMPSITRTEDEDGGIGFNCVSVTLPFSFCYYTSRFPSQSLQRLGLLQYRKVSLPQFTTRDEAPR